MFHRSLAIPSLGLVFLLALGMVTPAVAAGVAAMAALSHHHSAPAATPAPTPVPQAAPVVAAPVAPAPAPVAAAPVGAIAVNTAGTVASLAADRGSAADSMVEAINDCNLKSHGNSCAVHVQFTSVDYELCGAVAVRRVPHNVFIGSATAGSERDAEARALMKAGTGSTILAHGCNSH
ncbi:MAG: DUF4189 domain-containing protein [Candidatus Eremiobacteraeota bacterium]|nr:DUF4189 domain-containing protein [Candidatus Eremiobacteraeota bacterium]